MATNVPIKKQIVIEKSAVITFEHVVDEMAFRRYLEGSDFGIEKLHHTFLGRSARQRFR